MKILKVTIAESSRSYRASTSDLHGRILQFPDSVARYILLPAALWESLRWLTSERGWTEAALVGHAYDWAVDNFQPECEEFEEHLRWTVSNLLADVAALELVQPKHLANRV